MSSSKSFVSLLSTGFCCVSAAGAAADIIGSAFSPLFFIGARPFPAPPNGLRVGRPPSFDLPKDGKFPNGEGLDTTTVSFFSVLFGEGLLSVGSLGSLILSNCEERALLLIVLERASLEPFPSKHESIKGLESCPSETPIALANSSFGSILGLSFKFASDLNTVRVWSSWQVFRKSITSEAAIWPSFVSKSSATTLSFCIVLSPFISFFSCSSITSNTCFRSSARSLDSTPLASRAFATISCRSSMFEVGLVISFKAASDWGRVQ
mmetsp:Transcript_27542/g.44374  ORF Transcript_27542/g.44374 Transcript_27542/m.44374 type:complete len:265 (-) Transcript_27542:47-841(-)